jgi:REP element-mobilizing transposase RayT
MSVRRNINETNGIYFISFTCAQWIHLFEMAQSYYVVYKWFDHLKSKGHYILAYVIMPNHVHAIIAFVNTGKIINKIVGNGKRFMAYDQIAKMQELDLNDTLHYLESLVNDTDKKNGKIHEVFEPSCDSRRILEQKLDYIHMNPCKGKWKLVENPEDYIHSSAKFYATGEQGVYSVTNYAEVEDIDLTWLRRDIERYMD